MTVEVHFLKADEPSPYQEEVIVWSYANVIKRPEMRRRGLTSAATGLLVNLSQDRIELFYVKDGEPTGGMIFTEYFDDLHFGMTPSLLGSWVDDPSQARQLYKRALEVLKERGHKSILRTMRVNETTYKTIYKEF